MIVSTALLCLPLLAPGPQVELDRFLGSWSGAYVRSGSALRVDVRVTRDDEGRIVAEERIPDWVYYGWLDPVELKTDERGRLTFNSTYGEAFLFDDAEYGELFGPAGRWSPEVTLHLKRSLPEPEPAVVEVPVTFESDVRLEGTLVLPEGEGPFPCLVRIHGRGCSTRGRHRRQGRVFARYGYATFAYDQRGAGKSEGDCGTRTFDELVRDAEAAYSAALSDPRIAPERIGLIGGSAGAWTAQALTERLIDDEERPDPAFLVTWIGASTSILQQQLDSGRAIGASLGLTEAQIALVDRQVELAGDRTSPPEEIFAALEAIRVQATEEGWLDRMFGDDDFPPSADQLDRIWLRRHSYDPTALLSGLSDVPYLGVFGERDDVVPASTNVENLRTLLIAAGNERFRIEVVPGLPHSTERGNVFRVFPGAAGGLSYFKFDRVEPVFFSSTIEFLRELELGGR